MLSCWRTRGKNWRGLKVLNAGCLRRSGRRLGFNESFTAAAISFQIGADGLQGSKTTAGTSQCTGSHSSTQGNAQPTFGQEAASLCSLFLQKYFFVLLVRVLILLKPGKVFFWQLCAFAFIARCRNEMYVPVPPPPKYVPAQINPPPPAVRFGISKLRVLL